LIGVIFQNLPPREASLMVGMVFGIDVGFGDFVLDDFAIPKSEGGFFVTWVREMQF
jgi:hypothetical protein